MATLLLDAGCPPLMQAQGEDCLKRLFSPVATHLLDGRVPRIGVAQKSACGVKCRSHGWQPQTSGGRMVGREPALRAC